MINFIDESGQQHSAVVECKKTKGVNGEKSLSGTIYTNDEILEGIGRGWRLQFEDENYCLTYVNPIDEGNRIVVEFDAVHEFFYDLKKSVVYSELNGSHTADTYLKHIFTGSGYEYRLEVTIPAFEKESFGMKNRLDLFKDFISSTGVEFSVNGKIVRILEKVGTNLSTIVKKGFNLNELRIEKDAGSFITYLRGYGAFVDSDDESKGRLEVEYLSPLASVYGKLEGDPIVDERYKVESNFIDRLKNDVESSYGISIDIDMEDLTRAGYEYDQPHEGDYIMAINKDLGFEQKIRIMSYTTSYDTEGNIIDHDVSCGSDNIIQKKINEENEYQKEVQAGLENAISTANQAWISADGKNKVFQGPDRPATANKGDIWYQIDGEQTIMNYWDGYDWVPFINPEEVKDSVDQAKEAGEKAQEAADQAAEDAKNAKAKADAIEVNVNGVISDVATINGTINVISTKANDAFDKAQAVEGKTVTLEKTMSGFTGRLTDIETESDATTKKLNEIVVTVEGQTQTISSVQTTASSALNKANVLETTVEGQTQFISEVQVAATTATLKANNAQATADGNKATISTVKTTADSALSKATQVETTANGLKTTISSVQTTANNALTKATQVETTANGIRQTVVDVQTQLDLTDVKADLSQGIILNNDPIFTNALATNFQPFGADQYLGVIEVRLVTDTTLLTPSGNDRALRIRANGPSPDPYPGYGGFYYMLTPKPNGRYIVKFTAKVPKERQLMLMESNASAVLGTNGKIRWLTANRGTGEWETYAFLAEAGSSGDFADFASVYADNAPGNNDVGYTWYWYVDKYEIIDSSLSVQSQFTQISTAINLKVSNNDVINQINVSTESILIAGNKVHITGQTTIDNGVIGRAQIANLAVSTAQIADAAITNAKMGNISANKINTGVLNANLVSVINLNASNITSGYLSAERLQSKSITADKLSADAIKVGFNAIGNTVQVDSDSLDILSGNILRMQLDADGLNFFESLNTKLGQMGANHKTGNTSIRGISVDIETSTDYVSWAYKKSSTDTEYTNMLTLDPRGNFYGEGFSGIRADLPFRFQAGINPTGSSNSPVKIQTTTYNSTNYPSITGDSGKAGLLFGSSALYLLHNGIVYPVRDIVSVVNALHGLGRVYLPTAFFATGGGVQSYKIVNL